MGIKSRFIQARDFIGQNKENLAVCAEFVLIAAIFFGLGILYDKSILKDNNQINIIEPEAADQAQAISALAGANQPTEKPRAQNINGTLAKTGDFVASKNGKAYYLLTCKNNIKEENKIYFKTKEDADKAGFQPAKTCFK